MLFLDNLLFKIVRHKATRVYNPQLCSPTSKVEMLLHFFHSSPLSGHITIAKIFLTLIQRFFCPNLAHHVRAFIIRVFRQLSDLVDMLTF